MTKYRFWEKEWHEHRAKAKVLLDRFCLPNTLDWQVWDEYKAESKKSNHAFGVMRRCRWTPPEDD